MATFEEILQKIGVSPETLEQAKKQQQEQGGTLREQLIALGEFTEQSFGARVAQFLRVPYLSVQNRQIPHDVLKFLPQEKAEKYLALPIEFDKKNRRLTVAMADPTDMSAIDNLKFAVGHTIIPRYTPEEELRDKLQHEYAQFAERELVASLKKERTGRDDSVSAVVDVQALLNADQAVSKLLGQLLSLAAAEHASELAMKPARDRGVIVMTAQGKTRELIQLPLKSLDDLLTRLKRVLSVESSEPALAYVNGYALLVFGNQQERDLAYLWHVGLNGEEVILRCACRDELPTLADFDLLPQAQRDLQSALQCQTGAIVTTGTTQSGVGATRYLLLNLLKETTGQIASIESPMFIALPCITQGAVAQEAGYRYDDYLNYAQAQRPRVVMIDHLFDNAMIEAALRLASSALVVSSIEAADAASAIMKLRGFAGTLPIINRVRCVTSQRMVKKICDACKEQVALSDAHREKLGLNAGDDCYAGKGCDQCGGTGYNGAAYLFEAMPINESLIPAISESETAKDLRAVMAEQGMVSLRDDGMRKVKLGVTTIQEVLKATML